MVINHLLNGMILQVDTTLHGLTRDHKLSKEKNPALLSIESWLFNRDPYIGLLIAI